MKTSYQYPLPSQDYEVLVVTFTYNQERYIEDALKGIVMQKTNFKFVALVLDDCSTDGTADTIKKYEAEYPDIIKGIYQPENHFQQRKSQEEYIQPWRERSKYQAFCEGDDYWTDPLKLQTQYEFMENHPECVLSFHNVIEHWEDGSRKDKEFFNIENKEYSGCDLLKDWIVPTCSVMAQTKLSHSEVVIRNMNSGSFLWYDIVLYLSCAVEGKVYGMKKTMGIYRRSTDGYSLSMFEKFKTSKEIMDRFCNHYLAIIEEFSSSFGNSFRKIAEEKYIFHLCRGAFYLFLQLDLQGAWGYLKRSVSYSVSGTIKVFVNLLVGKITSLIK